MINYITIGTNDLDRARVFYDAIFAEFGVPRLHDDEEGRFSFYSNGEGAGIMLTRPYDGQPATVGNGSMLALEGQSEERVQALYDKAIELGATCDGAPGIRGDGISFGAYVRDLDGNKLAFMHLLVG